MIRVFIGLDRRQPVAANLAAHSLVKRSSVPVSVTFLETRNLPISRTGLTDFTFSRFLVPYLCGYSGSALFVDADMLFLADVATLPVDILQENAEIEDGYDRSVYVSHDVEPFERPSVMWFNCEHCAKLTPDFIENGSPFNLESWADAGVGKLPKDWNHIVPYSGENPNAKLVHFTQGIPCFDETRNCEYSREWNQEILELASTVSWQEIMGNSVHAKRMNT